MSLNIAVAGGGSSYTPEWLGGLFERLDYDTGVPIIAHPLLPGEEGADTRPDYNLRSNRRYLAKGISEGQQN